MLSNGKPSHSPKDRSRKSRRCSIGIPCASARGPAVIIVRWRSSESLSLNRCVPKASTKSPACSLPCSSSGISVCPWALRPAFQAVCPCRTRYTRIARLYLPGSGFPEFAPRGIDAKTADPKNTNGRWWHRCADNLSDAGAEIDESDHPVTEILPLLIRERADQVVVSVRRYDRRPRGVEDVEGPCHNLVLRLFLSDEEKCPPSEHCQHRRA